MVKVGLVLLAVVGWVPAGMAAPCENVVATMTPAEVSALASSLVRQLSLEGQAKVDVKGMFRNGDWTIVQASPGALAEVFLFFKGNPAVTRYVTEWGGTPPRDRTDVAKWAAANAPGIPGDLASCFADRVAAGQ